MPRQDDLKELIVEHNRRLQKLKEQEVQHGTPVDPKIILEIEDIEAELAKLVAELEALPEIIRQNPYRGLFAFREEDADVFFGRETFTSQLVESVQQKPLVALLGSSGSGKSSIVFAGLLPRLRGEGNWLIASFRPGCEPFRALAAALLLHLEPDLTDRLRFKKIKSLAADLEQGELTLVQVVTRILEKSPDADRFLLIADQFEEFYTLGQAGEIRRRFLDLLLEKAGLATPGSVQGGGPGSAPTTFHLVLTLRADFLGRALLHPLFGDALQDKVKLLRPMNPDELRLAIEKPADIREVTFEPGLVERILEDVRNEPGNLPLMEFALSALWEQQTKGVLTHATYEAVGRVEGALSHQANQVYEALSEAEQEQARRVFIQMVRPGEGTEDTRRLATKAELGETTWGLVQRLAAEGLAVTDQDLDKQETVEVVHEVLIGGWERLRDWMDEDRVFRAWQERLRADIRRWQASKQAEGALLRGALLAEAEAWLGEREPDLGLAEREFIQASLMLREMEQQREEEVRYNRLVLEIINQGAVGRDLSRVDLSKADLSEATLREATLREADLSRADLSEADLRRANLSAADLRRANLMEADLSRADLSRVGLSEANLTGATLLGAGLSRANLVAADLSKANLMEANLIGVNLRGANLSEANLSRTTLRGADLRWADLHGINLNGAIYDEATVWPEGFDPVKAGAILVY